MTLLFLNFFFSLHKHERFLHLFFPPPPFPREKTMKKKEKVSRFDTQVLHFTLTKEQSKPNQKKKKRRFAAR